MRQLIASRKFNIDQTLEIRIYKKFIICPRYMWDEWKWTIFSSVYYVQAYNHWWGQSFKYYFKHKESAFDKMNSYGQKWKIEESLINMPI